ncbi:MAG: 50S ribosomal protein L6 [Acidobacteriota bacterium]|nr:50S ribosomal protein L6 [Acidobacteriota bacterium]
MSRIGRMPIELDAAVKIKIDGSTVNVEGPKGKLQHTVPDGITVAQEEKQLVVRRADDSKTQRALHGLSRALLANAVNGVTKGFVKDLEIHGVGYRAELAGKVVKFSLGFSHPIVFPIPDGIAVAVEKNTKLSVSGYDRQQVGQVAAEIRSLRPPDVYKLKGIRYTGEQLRKKAGKTGA